MSDYQLSNFPGPTDEARRIQLRQAWAFEAICDIHCYPEIYATPADMEAALATANAAYDATVAELEALLGPDAHCSEVDSELFSSYSDCFKSENDFRPRGHTTRAEVKAWFERLVADQRRQDTPEPPPLTLADLPTAPPVLTLGDKLKAAINARAH